MQATYYVDTVIPGTQATIGTCLRDGREIVEMPEAAF